MANGFNPSGIWHPGDRGFSMGVVQPAGHVLHLTGQVAWDEDERIVGKGDVEVQTRQCYDNIRAILRTRGGILDDILSITTCFTDRSQLPVIQRVRASVFRDVVPPASTSIMVAGLGHEDFLVELTPIAVIPTERFIAVP